MMSLPIEVRESLTEKLGTPILSEWRISGGDINQAAGVKTTSGEFFVKWNADAPADMFEKEAMGLDRLREANCGATIPDIAGYSTTGSPGPGWLVMDFIRPGGGGSSPETEFGICMARLHSVTDDAFGLDQSNYIGRLPQSNQPTDSWSDFFINERIHPQLKLAVDGGRLDRSLISHWDSLAARLPSIFPDASPSLLHGDLWSGNCFFSETGESVLVDPAVYFGHPEMELAFTHMFGSFPKHFYSAYESVSPLEAGFSDRIPVYNLYPLLVHTNHFGGFYAQNAAKFLKQY